MFHWNQPGVEHFTFQTKWMAERLVTRDHNNEVYSGGLLSDVTYRLFETGYLLSTSMFCEETGRWIPVQLSWIRGLSAEYYQAHFTMLFEQFLQPSFSFLDRETLVRQVVDFSLAQREGFISAYMKKPPKRNPANRKKAELNDGQAPDTTAALLPKNSGGRPPGSRNLIKDSMTTYISYSASDAPARKFQCCRILVEFEMLRFSTIFNQDEQKMSDKQLTFIAGLDFPRYLEFHGVKYTLFARGFWNGSHYWCKMLKNLGGISGVWMHDDRQNGGIAWLISPDQSTIAGRAPNTSWVFYSRPCSSSEDKFVSKSIANIARDHPGAPGSLPFAHLGMLLNNSPSQLIPTLNEDHSPIEDQQIAALSDKQGPNSILSDGKEVAAAPKKNRRPKKVNLPLNEDDLPIEDQHIAAVSDKQAKLLLDAKEVATAQKKKWRPKKVTRLQEAGSSPSGAAQATIGAPSGEEKPG
ncbi:hypothetical protein PTTG_08129, partial [Puccinia triticina 1-1 BBBD Race 1]